jgi:hypothetical protein
MELSNYSPIIDNKYPHPDEIKQFGVIAYTKNVVLYGSLIVNIVVAIMYIIHIPIYVYIPPTIKKLDNIVLYFL